MGPVFIFIAVIFCVHIIQTKVHLFRCGSRIPGPWTVPLIGSIQFMSQIRPEALFVLVDKLRNTYRSTFRIWLGTQLWVFLYSAEETREALNEPSLVKADTFQLLNTLIGNGLLISEGRHWQVHRRALGPAFHANVLADFTNRIHQHAKIFVEKVLTKRTADVGDFIFPCVLDTICDTSMGVNLRAQQDEDSPYTQAFHETSHLLFKRMVNPLLSSELIYHRTPSYARLRKAVHIIHGMTDRVIKEQANYLKSHGTQTQGKYSRSLLNLLLTAEIDGQPLPFNDIKDEVNTFLFAGVDTTTAAMGFVLYCLGKYPACQEKLVQEILSNPGDPDHPNVNELHYLDMFIKECLRLYTIVPLTGRQVTRDVKIGNFNLCRGTTLWINMYGLAHDEKYFPEPNLFKPERFAKDAPELPPFAFIPFSGGPHSCIGRKYALLIMKILTVETLLQARVQLRDPDEELLLMAEMVLKSKNGIHLMFERRNGMA